MKEDDKPTLGALAQDAKEYADLKVELFKLEMTDKAATLTAAMFSFLFTFLVITFLFISVYICSSLMIGQFVGNYALGFGISGGALLMILLLYWFFFKNLTQKYISDKIVSFFYATT